MDDVDDVNGVDETGGWERSGGRYKYKEENGMGEGRGEEEREEMLRMTLG